MNRLRTQLSPLPGLALSAVCAATAFGLARLPGAAVLGPLVLALVVAALARAVLLRGSELGRYAAGARVAAGPVLKLGIVALGARLDMRAVLELGPAILAGSVLGAVVAFAAAEAAGRMMRVPPDLRRSAGMGTAICGASAIAASAPALHAKPAHTSAAIGAISLLGTLGVLGFALYDTLAPSSAFVFGTLAGATLQEVGQVVAAGSVAGVAGADLALLVKLSRVVLLGPALVALSWRPTGARNATPPAWSRTEAQDREASAMASGSGVEPAPAVRHRGRRWPVPPFVLGFLAMGAAVSAGLLGAAAVGLFTVLGTLLTATAMAGIGLGLDARALRGPGRQALAVGLVSFLVLLVVMIGYYALWT